ncbi:MAG TPA: glycosyltransferase [Blastocatellia bacterium]|nr:glycosyltransferase [Blastocatellia bacterium]
MQPDISVIIATYNRAAILPVALDSIISQKTEDVSYEILLIDNNSTDETRDVAEGYVSRSNGRLRYILEKKQGVSYARNKGLELSTAPIVAFFDDDVVVAANWVGTVKRIFEQNPQVGCIGGKVLPLWQTEPPKWLTREHWAPLALQDYGNEPFLVNFKKPLCLISANLAIRRAVFNEVGLFKPELQRVKDGIGSMEDLELLMRLWQAGVQTMYVPELIAKTWVPLDRTNKRYHRRWHHGNGHFHALLRSDEIERSATGHFSGIPAHLYRQTIEALLQWLRYSVTGNASDAFRFETKLHFFRGFASKRWQWRGKHEDVDSFDQENPVSAAKKKQIGAL